jgi:hypothetical protein
MHALGCAARTRAIVSRWLEAMPSTSNESHWLADWLTLIPSQKKSLTGSRGSATVIAVFDAGAED